MKSFDEQGFTRELIATLARLCDRHPDSITLDHELRGDLGLDSLQSMELLNRLSEQWDLSLAMEEAVGVRTVRDVVRLAAQVAAS